jgi:glycosyltransferase involved in cell wall biosynthesis
MPLPALLGLLRARMKGVRFFYWMSYPMPEGQLQLAAERGLAAGFMQWLLPWLRGHFGRLLLYRIVLGASDHIFVQSERMKSDIVERGIAADRVTAVPMGVDLESIERHAVMPSDDPRLVGKRTLVYLGTLDRARQIELLFEMLAILQNDVPTAVLVLVGDTHDETHRTWLLERAAASGVEKRVIWTGWLPTEKAWRYVRAADLGLSPIPRGSLFDGSSPTKVLEYLALGTPVLCTDNPDQERIIAATGAGMCVPHSAYHLAVAAKQLLASQDQSVRARTARAGYAYIAANRDYRVLSKRLADTYALVCGNSHAVAP